jgi:hypothetical protein
MLFPFVAKGVFMKKSRFTNVGCLALLITTKALSLNYETYLESWDSQWESVEEGLPPADGDTTETSYNGVVLNISFACYSFPGLNGLQFSDSDVATVRDFVDSHAGTNRISFGGASYAPPCAPNYFISQTTGWPGNYQELADGVLDVVSDYSFNGVDFDIEDSQPTAYTPEEFANQLISFLKAVRAGLPSDKTLSITIPGQGWGTYWYYLATGAAAIDGLIDYINFMEYDIWVNTAIGYEKQIEADITTYTADPSTSPEPNWSPGWGIPPGLIQLGLMPGCDDVGNYLSVDDAVTLTSYAYTKGLYGLMTWDLDRDSGSSQTPPCSIYPTNYEYTTAIRNKSKELETSPQITYSLSQRKTRTQYYHPFDRRSPPNHGSPISIK